MPTARKKRSTPAASTGLHTPTVIEVKAGVFKDTCLQLLDAVRRREMEVVVTKHGKAVARLVPVDARAPTSRGFMRGTVLSCEDIVSPDFEPWGDLG
jgi:antitoxin (DNA-binding transcriptional repressor) of toxin-antitoxin stability system